jgi:Pvc16 N-terminal domain/IPT/TIG domain
LSNFLAIATVTETLRRLLQQEIGFEIPGINITIQPPDTITAPPPAGGLNIFLFHVSKNQGFSGVDLPTRNSNFELMQRPLLGIDLHYLLTAYGDGNNDLAAHAILASTIRILHESPLLSKNQINDTIMLTPELAGSDLAEQMEQVRITPQPLSLEEITKLASSFFENRYRLSTVYLATVVLLHSVGDVRSTLPVRKPAIHVIPFKQPLIQRIEPQVIEWSNNARITIIGKNLKHDEIVVVRIGQVDVTPQPSDVTNDRISVTIPNNVTAGIKSIQVAHELRFGTRPDPYRIFASNIAAFVLAPTITNIVTPMPVRRGSDLVFNIEPAVISGQKVECLIGSLTISIPSMTGNQVLVPIPVDIIPPGAPQTDFLLRVRVDGAESFLQTDREGRFIGPTVTITL